ncbi:MAG: galactose mutarotase [Acidobacteriaceae bacterium]|nr:galactose mutarotase [Acidobacteriaceae bacterium]MBV9502657.1 galactose mutarotase [Acidobacteriaceae bacterium]
MIGERKKENWGHLPSGEKIDIYTLRNSKGMEARITNYGGRVVSLLTPDRHNRFEDVVLGFDDLEGYLGKNPYFGALVGRYANRISNAQFVLGGHEYHLAQNNGKCSLHGGWRGFDRAAWEARETELDGCPALELQLISPDGDEGYPGQLSVKVQYALTENGELRIEYEASTDKPTIVNLTNHSYFNLAGQPSGSIAKHLVMINADKFTPVNEHLIPTGELRPVAGTPFDFRTPEEIGKRLHEDSEQLKLGLGFDHNYALNGGGSRLSLAARVTDPNSGRTLEVHTTQPGMQFYTGNHLDGSVHGKRGIVYGFRSAFCLETQHFPDSPHHPNFPSTELRPGQRYQQATVYKFSVE